MEVLRFQNPGYLYALFGVVLLIFFFRYVFKMKKALLERFGHLEMLQKMMPGLNKKRVIQKVVLFNLMYIFTIIALANPQIGTKLEEVKREGVDVIIALDVSLSMMAEDVAPNRLEKAKHEISKFIDLLQGDRIGLIAFAGISHVQCPLTLDYSAAKLFLRMMDTHLIPVPGTNIADAISKARKAFDQKDRKHKVMILITDGEEHREDAIEEAKKAADEGIIIYTVGIGSTDGVPIPLYDKNGNRKGFKKDKDGNVVTTKLDVSTLQKIAFTTDGKYYIATSGESELDHIYKEINGLDKKELASHQFSQYESRFQFFIIIALILLIFEMFLPVKSKKNEEI
jgi:Ca-activated chloride channel family protein